jgi:hypothetical protein
MPNMLDPNTGFPAQNELETRTVAALERISNCLDVLQHFLLTVVDVNDKTLRLKVVDRGVSGRYTAGGS